MDGGVCFNEWLIQEGYLALKEPPSGLTKFDPSLVDWTRTRAWGDGGYYGRLFLNVRGREPQGIVAPEAVEALKAELTAGLEALPDDAGCLLGNRVFRPEQVFRDCRNVAPDLIVYFGDLHWRSVGSIGHGSIWTHENDIGPDDANHAQFGIFLMAEARDLIGPAPFVPPGTVATNRRDGLSLYDVAPTVLTALGIEPPPGMGRAVIGGRAATSDSAYTEEEEAELARRLEDLGYL
jgi:predicted AlkP superfamily phosphohydrolase/phosphomutase